MMIRDHRTVLVTPSSGPGRVAFFGGRVPLESSEAVR